MSLRSSRSALLALGIGIALAFGLVPQTSIAQTPQQLPGVPQPERPPSPPPQFERGYAGEFDRRQNRLERRLEFLHSELQIRPAQQPLWEAFADVLRREAEIGRNRIADGAGAFREPDRRPPPLGAVERLERRQQNLFERSEHYDRLLAALTPLYEALDATQRQAADEHLFLPGRGDRFRGGPRRFGLDREFGGNRYGPFDRPFGPYPPNERFNRYYR